MEAVNTTVVNLQSHACLGARLAQRAVQWRASESARSDTQKTSSFVVPVLSVSPLGNTRRNAHCYRRRRFLCSWFNMSHIVVQLWNIQFFVWLRLSLGQSLIWMSFPEQSSTQLECHCSSSLCHSRTMCSVNPRGPAKWRLYAIIFNYVLQSWCDSTWNRSSGHYFIFNFFLKYSSPLTINYFCWYLWSGCKKSSCNVIANSAR